MDEDAHENQIYEEYHEVVERDFRERELFLVDVIRGGAENPKALSLGAKKIIKINKKFNKPKSI